jgi:4-hydroxybenzoate polyprenyltransferase
MRLFSPTFLKSLFKPLLAIFASTRGYTILVIVVAQYLSARYILAPDRTWIMHLSDYRLFFLVLASSFAIAGGYLINNFYDAEKDQINRPQQYLLHHMLSPINQLRYYAIFNLSCLGIAWLISYRAFLFFLIYIAGIWLYSHLLKKTFWASNFFAAFLAIIPFFAIGLYFNNLSNWVLYHAVFLFLMILIRDMIKDLQNFKGDWVRKYNTTAVVFGVKTTKFILSGFVLFSIYPIALLLSEKNQLGWMYYYFILTLPYLFGILLLIWKATTQKMYLWAHNLLNFLILAGVVSIVLVRYSI